MILCGIYFWHYLTEDWRGLLSSPWLQIALALTSVVCGAIVGAEREKRELARLEAERLNRARIEETGLGDARRSNEHPAGSLLLVDGKEAEQPPDLIILDLSLPDMDGIEVCKQLRNWTKTPVIVLSVRDSEHDKVTALDKGADDSLTKPFGIEELLARVRVALRHSTRAQGTQSKVIKAICRLISRKVGD